MPWYTVASTSVSAEDQECITNYINSGRHFNDVAIPVIYIKRLMDNETLKIFMLALTKAIGENALHTTRTIVDTLSAVVMGEVPKKARLTKVLNHIRTNNVMGDRGENTITFSEGLMFDLHQNGW